jgi:hypothetical protein
MGFGIEHKVQVITIVSRTASAKGTCSADPRSSDTGTIASAARLLASRSYSVDGSNDAGDCRAVERQVQPGPDAELKNQPSGQRDRLMTIVVK